MTQHEPLTEQPALGRLKKNPLALGDSGGQPVNRIAGDQRFLNHRVRGRHMRAGRSRELDPLMPPGDCDHVFDRQLSPVDNDRHRVITPTPTPQLPASAEAAAEQTRSPGPGICPAVWRPAFKGRAHRTEAKRLLRRQNSRGHERVAGRLPRFMDARSGSSWTREARMSPADASDKLDRQPGLGDVSLTAKA
jgi:hypothetical protein